MVKEIGFRQCVLFFESVSIVSLRRADQCSFVLHVLTDSLVHSRKNYQMFHFPMTRSYDRPFIYFILSWILVCICIVSALSTPFIRCRRGLTSDWNKLRQDWDSTNYVSLQFLMQVPKKSNLHLYFWSNLMVCWNCLNKIKGLLERRYTTNWPQNLHWSR